MRLALNASQIAKVWWTSAWLMPSGDTFKMNMNTYPVLPNDLMKEKGQVQQKTGAHPLWGLVRLTVDYVLPLPSFPYDAAWATKGWIFIHTLADGTCKSSSSACFVKKANSLLLLRRWQNWCSESVTPKTTMDCGSGPTFISKLTDMLWHFCPILAFLIMVFSWHSVNCPEFLLTTVRNWSIWGD